MKRWHILLLDAVLLAAIPLGNLLTNWMLAVMPPCFVLEYGLLCPVCGGTRCVRFITEGNFLSTKDEKYQSLMKEMQQISANLGIEINFAVLRNKQLTEQLDKLLKSKQWAYNMKKTKGRVAKHEDRMKGIQAFQNTEKGKAMTKEQQFKYYQKTFNADGITDAKKEEDKRGNKLYGK